MNFVKVKVFCVAKWMRTRPSLLSLLMIVPPEKRAEQNQNDEEEKIK